jgi:hypothetical protein
MDQTYYATEYGMQNGFSQQGFRGGPSYNAPYAQPSHDHHGGYMHAQHAVSQTQHYSQEMHPFQHPTYGHQTGPAAAAGPYLQTQGMNAQFTGPEHDLITDDDQLRAVRELPERFQPLFTQFR